MNPTPALALTSDEIDVAARRTHHFWRKGVIESARFAKRPPPPPPEWHELPDEAKNDYRLLVAFVEGFVSEKLRALAAKRGGAA